MNHTKNDDADVMTETTGKKAGDAVKCGYVAVIGLPNAGKSTLMNRYLKEKVSIVTPKPQTTRANVTCILSSDTYQIIFIDTPGLLRPRYRMQEVMASLIQTAIGESDVILVIIDAAAFREDIHPRLAEILESIKRKKALIALNKIDLIHPKTKLLTIIEKTTERFGDIDIVPLSALTGDGTGDLFSLILDRLPEGPKLYPDDIISTEPERFFVAELIREAIFLTMSEEIPYASGVVIDDFSERETVTVIHASILVEKKSQKPIIIGRNGSTIKEIGIKARRGIEEFLARKVFLDLHVKVRKDWRNKDTFLREIGLKR
ncbi:GTPase Era [Candidatus Latescibacterota bacterium]